MSTQLLCTTTSAAPNLSGWVALAVLAFIGWRLLLCWWFPYGPCHRCKGTGKHRSGTYWRPCRRCNDTGRRVRLGRWVWDWIRSRDDQRTRT
jgi:hypothetical protein